MWLPTPVSRRALKEALGEDLAVLDELTDAEAAELLTMYDAAREEAASDLLASLDKSLQHVPRLIRGPVRMILFPKGS